MKTDPLARSLRSLQGGVGIAFSGGVDSTFLLRMANALCKGPVVPFFLTSPLVHRRERRWAEDVSRRVGVHLIQENWDPLGFPEVLRNHEDRCYRCKLAMYRLLWKHCEKMGISCLLDGTQQDDLGADRPGHRAISELHVLTPLADAGLGKEEIRGQSHRFSLPTADRPSQSCLATRVETGIRLSIALLRKIEYAENCLQDLGIWPTRFRVTGVGIDLHIPPPSRLAAESHWHEIKRVSRWLGFGRICLHELPIGKIRSSPTFDRGDSLQGRPLDVEEKLQQIAP